MKILLKIFVMMFFLFFTQSIYAKIPYCSDDISQADFAMFKAANLDPPIFKCHIDDSKDEWLYNEVSQDDYNNILNELKEAYPQFSTMELINLRYAILLQYTLDTFELNRKQQKTFMIFSFLNISQYNIEDMQNLVNNYYDSIKDKLDITQREILEIKLYGALKAIKKNKDAKDDSRQFSAIEIKEAEDENKEIVKKIENLIAFKPKNKAEEIIIIDAINNLALMYNANLVINNGKNYKERKRIAYENHTDDLLYIENILYEFALKIDIEAYELFVATIMQYIAHDNIVALEIKKPFNVKECEYFIGFRKLNIKTYVDLNNLKSIQRLTQIATSNNSIAEKNLEASIVMSEYAKILKQRVYFMQYVWKYVDSMEDKVKISGEYLDYCRENKNME